jgi:hypothetical protein
VQAISKGETVQLFTVTVCDRTLHPSFPGSPGTSIRLGISTFLYLHLPDAKARYNYSGATANSNFIDALGFGNPGNYKTYFWGLDDACPDWPTEEDRLVTEGAMRWTKYSDRYVGRASRTVVRTFRRYAVLNTYGEAGVFVDVRPIEKRFQIGVDRILVRTVRSGT